MKTKTLGSLVVRVGVAIASYSVAISKAAAQSCAMCYQNAAASGPQGKAALQHGILILFIPAVSIFGGILCLLYSRRHVSYRGPRGCASGATPNSLASASRFMFSAYKGFLTLWKDADPDVPILKQAQRVQSPRSQSPGFVMTTTPTAE
jgi:hypothetical protein